MKFFCVSKLKRELKKVNIIDVFFLIMFLGKFIFRKENFLII